MIKIKPIDRDQIDAGRTDVEKGCDSEIDIELLDLGRAMQLVIGVERYACVFKLDFRIENEIVVELIRRRQHESRGIETGLPLAIGGWVLLSPEVHFAIRANSEAGERRRGDTEQIRAGWRRRLESGCFRSAKEAGGGR